MLTHIQFICKTIYSDLSLKGINKYVHFGSVLLNGSLQLSKIRVVPKGVLRFLVQYHLKTSSQNKLYFFKK